MEIIAWAAIIIFIVNFSIHCGIWFGEKLDKTKKHWALNRESMIVKADCFYLIPTIAINFFSTGAEIIFYWLNFEYYAGYQISKE